MPGCLLTGNDGHGQGKVALEKPCAILDLPHGVEPVFLLSKDQELRPM